MIFFQTAVLLLSLAFPLSLAAYAHEGHQEPQQQDSTQIELVRKELPQDDTALALTQEARARCLDIAAQSAGDMEAAGPMHADDAAWMTDCVVNVFTDRMVETMHGFILFQGTEIYRHCTTGEMSGRMDNFGECMQPFDILIERVSAPCREAFGQETDTAHACIKLFNEKMLSKAGQMATDRKESTVAVNLNSLWYTLGAVLMISGALFLIYKRL